MRRRRRARALGAACWPQAWPKGPERGCWRAQPAQCLCSAPALRGQRNSNHHHLQLSPRTTHGRGKNIAGLSNEIIPTSPAHAQSFLAGGWALLPVPPSWVQWKREQGVQHRPRLRAHSCPRPLTSPRNVLLPFTKHLYSPPA